MELLGCPLGAVGGYTSEHYVRVHRGLGLLSCGAHGVLLSRRELAQTITLEALGFRRRHPWLYEGVPPETDPEPAWLAPATEEAWRLAVPGLFMALPATLAARLAYHWAAADLELDHGEIMTSIAEAARRVDH